MASCGPIPIATAQTAEPPKNETRADGGLFGDGRVNPGDKRKFSINARVAFDLQHLADADLDDRSGSDRTAILPELRVDLSYLPKKHVEIYVSLELGNDFVREDADWRSRSRLELREAYVLIDHSIARDIEFQLGRQRFKDRRQWLYDERLDAIRLAYDHKAWRVEVAFAREELVRKDVLHRRRSRGKVDNMLLRAEYELTRDWDLAAYVLKQDDRLASNLSPTFIGLQSRGKITPRLGHWLELSRQRGTAGTRRLRAKAFDAGLIYALPIPLRPAIFAGYARGSGGGDARTSHEFRQTGLQDNEDRITGLGNVRYYGELLDPDLSNLSVQTVGVGVRPTSDTSLEIVGHRYRQVRANDNDVRGSPVSPELSGDNRSIGTELDAIFAARIGDRLGLEAKIGWFRPGAGFEGRSSDAFLAKIRIAKQF